MELYRRIIARAGDLAIAFNMNLTLFGFLIQQETRTPVEMMQWIAGTTSINTHEEREYFVELTEKNKFMKFPYLDRGFPP